MNSTFSFPTKVIFGPSLRKNLPEHLKSLKISRPLIVTDSGFAQTDPFKQFLSIGDNDWRVFSGVQPNPTLKDVEEATKAFREHGCDSIMAIGGGSSLDVGKIIRLTIQELNLDLKNFDSNREWKNLVPCIMIPTTAGTGSEVGRSSVITIDRVKRVVFHPSLLASLVVLDPELTTGLPPLLTAATGADALTHCIESFTSPVFHPPCEGIALEGIHLIAEALPRAVRNGNDLDARGKMLVAAMMGGIAFQKDLGAAHSMAHPLSSLCKLHHGLANALCLPFVMEWNSARKPGIYRRVGTALGLSQAEDHQTIESIKTLLSNIGLKPGLKNHGVQESDISELADHAFADSCHLTNPVPVTRDDLEQLYRQAL